MILSQWSAQSYMSDIIYCIRKSCITFNCNFHLRCAVMIEWRKLIDCFVSSVGRRASWLLSSPFREKGSREWRESDERVTREWQAIERPSDHQCSCWRSKIHSSFDEIMIILLVVRRGRVERGVENEPCYFVRYVQYPIRVQSSNIKLILRKSHQSRFKMDVGGIVY